MAGLVARRIIQYALLLFVAMAVAFVLPRIAPGGPLQTIAGADVGLLTPDEKAKLAADYGLDQPLHAQFIDYVSALSRGDLGYSYREARPVTDMLVSRVPWTILLAGLGLLIASLLGTLSGAYAALHKGGRRDVGVTGVFVFLQSLPAFWIGMVFIAIFATRLHWFPSFGATSIRRAPDLLGQAVDVGHHLALPLIVLVLATVPATFLATRYSMLGVLEEDFIDTAYAKGLPRRTILLRHALRNALLPIVTVFALHLGQVIAGAVVIETVFSYPGVGRLMYDSVLARDYPVLQAGFLIIAISVITANLIADVLYPILDPRARIPAR